jgi:hypothetical protein
MTAMNWAEAAGLCPLAWRGACCQPRLLHMPDMLLNEFGQTIQHSGPRHLQHCLLIPWLCRLRAAATTASMCAS